MSTEFPTPVDGSPLAFALKNAERDVPENNLVRRKTPLQLVAEEFRDVVFMFVRRAYPKRDPSNYTTAEIYEAAVSLAGLDDRIGFEIVVEPLSNSNALSLLTRSQRGEQCGPFEYAAVVVTLRSETRERVLYLLESGLAVIGHEVVCGQ